MRHTHKPRVSNFAVGLAVLILAAVAMYLAFGRDVPFTRSYQVKAVFSSANEVHGNSPVRIAGVEVGKVVKLERGPGSTAIVTMNVKDSGRPIHKDATMKVRPRIFLEGNFFVDVNPGTPSAPEVEDGDTIPLGQTAVPVQLDEVLTTLNSTTRDQLKTVLAEYGKALDKGGAEALHDSFAAWEGAFQNTAIVAEAVRGEREHDLSELISAAGRVATALASRDEQLAGLVTNLNVTAGALADRQAQVAASVRGLAELMRVSPGALAAVNLATPVLRAFVADVRPALRVAPGTLDLAIPFLRQVHAALVPAELPGLIADARPALRTLAQLQPRLVSLMNLVRPVTNCVNDNALPVLTAKLDDDRLSSNNPVWQDLLHGMVGLASASQNFDGNGPAVRYHGGYGDQLFSTGSVPQVGQLFGLTEEPIIGSRPPWPGPGNDPPFRPDLPCAQQARVNLTAGATPNFAASGQAKGRQAPLSTPTLDALAKLVAKRDRTAAAADGGGTRP